MRGGQRLSGRREAREGPPSSPRSSPSNMAHYFIADRRIPGLPAPFLGVTSRQDGPRAAGEEQRPWWSGHSQEQRPPSHAGGVRGDQPGRHQLPKSWQPQCQATAGLFVQVCDKESRGLSPFRSL